MEQQQQYASDSGDDSENPSEIGRVPPYGGCYEPSTGNANTEEGEKDDGDGEL